MAGGLTGFGYIDRIRQQQAASVPRVPDDSRYAREPRHGRAVERVRKQDGEIEFFPAQTAQEGPFGACERYDPVDRPLTLIEGGNPWFGQYSNFGVGKSPPDRAQSRERHDGVANPVRRTNQYFQTRSYSGSSGSAFASSKASAPASSPNSTEASVIKAS